MPHYTARLFWTTAILIGIGAVVSADRSDSPNKLENGPAVEAAMQEAATEMAEAANNLLATIDATVVGRAKFLVQDEERRNIHYFPIPRRGLPLKDLNFGQRHLVHALAATGLSTQGYVKAMNIMSVGQLLRDLDPEKPNPYRDPDHYYITIFGNPGPTGVWGWRLEGFHLSVNATIVDGKAIAIAPSFMGVHPATVSEGPRKGLRVLAKEEDLGRMLATSLTEEQRRIAFFPIPEFLTETVGGLITGNARKIENRQPEGLPASQLTAEQKANLWELIQLYANRHRGEVAQQDLSRIEEEGRDKIYFRWSGSVEPGKGHHYVIQGPTFLIEYDNTQNEANHVHCMWRNLENDFGDDLIRKHYQKFHKAPRKEN